jgi:hypothetical protein
MGQPATLRSTRHESCTSGCKGVHCSEAADLSTVAY